MVSRLGALILLAMLLGCAAAPPPPVVHPYPQGTGPLPVPPPT